MINPFVKFSANSDTSSMWNTAERFQRSGARTVDKMRFLELRMQPKKLLDFHSFGFSKSSKNCSMKACLMQVKRNLRKLKILKKSSSIYVSWLSKLCLTILLRTPLQLFLEMKFTTCTRFWLLPRTYLKNVWNLLFLKGNLISSPIIETWSSSSTLTRTSTNLQLKHFRSSKMLIPQ